MALKKSQLYSSLWQSCDELRGGMDASQYKDYVLVLLFIKYVSDKYAGQPYAPITIPKGASFKDMVALKGKSDIGDQINKKIIGPLADANKLSDMPDFNDPTKLGDGKEKVDRLTNLVAVPHIFATTKLDAVRGLGYVVARDRLFQLEMLTRRTAGTLTELVGAVALDADREQRRLGLAWSAEREYAETDADARKELDAFSEGVNAYIDGMGARDLPLEYRLLGKRPSPWKPVYTIYVDRSLGYTLAYHDSARSDEFRRERAVELVGERAADALFPVHAPIVEPIVPGARAYPVFDTTPLPPPLRSVVAARHQAADSRRDSFDLSGRDGEETAGSNQWAVGRRRSATGYPILAGDPHLLLTLPSIWYEAHLVVPDTLDVYGVTIPGAPSIIIGFNRDVAWTFTNTRIDVSDYYAETLDDLEQPRRYQLDGEWRNLENRVETYVDQRGRLLAVDTVYHTHRGPIRWRGGRPYSLRWTLLDSRGNLVAFSRAQHSASADEWLEAMRTYEAPSQNGLVADRSGTIAIRSPGWYPIRPGDGRGDVIRDGSLSASDWIGRWPSDRVPFVHNPVQGFVASANQEPLDPLEYSDYLASNWFRVWRAMRINALLRADSSVTVDEMRRFQTDPGSARADLFMPAFLEAAERRVAASPDTLLAQAAALLAEWDGRYTPDNRRAVLFEMAMDVLEERTWDELVDPDDGRRVWTPSEAVLWRLLQDSASPWWDVRDTPDRVEDRDELLSSSLRDAAAMALEQHGPPDGPGWRWGRVQNINIYHLLRRPALSALALPVAGGPGTLTPNYGDGRRSASWRMVVELGPEMRAWATYPGGQSGNPVSPWYDGRIPLWTAGELDPVVYPRTAEDLDGRPVASRLYLHPGKR